MSLSMGAGFAPGASSSVFAFRTSASRSTDTPALLISEIMRPSLRTGVMSIAL